MILPTYRPSPGTTTGREVWADLRVAMHSIEAYALDYVDEVIVAWDGPFAPDGMPVHPKIRYLERPKGMDQPDTQTWCIEQTTAEEIITTGDDVVMHPDSVRFLLEDRDILRANRPDIRIGCMGSRSNYVVGMQNIRTANGGEFGRTAIHYSSEGLIMEADKIHTVFCYFTREAWEAVGRFPKGLIWFGDVLFSYDLKRAGYTLVLSRSYVHHIGMRATQALGENNQSLHRQAVQWLRDNRRDFLEHWIGEGYLDPSERYAPTS